MTSKMAGRVGSMLVLALGLCLTVVEVETYREECPCPYTKLCAPLSVPNGKEVLGFMTSTENWLEYNWSTITTLALFTTFDDQELYDLMCFAHSKSVRVLLAGRGFGAWQLGNALARAAWINNYLSLAQQYFLDGINIDFEDTIEENSSDELLLTKLVNETYTAFKSVNSNYQVSFDVSWSPGCDDGRCYQYAQLAEYTDFLVIMAYDERDMVWEQPCTAGPNSATGTTLHGIQKYQQLGIPIRKLVLGLPWYGYDYICLTLSADNICTIKAVSRVGAPCSDAVGKQINYSDIMENFLPISTSGRLYNATSESPYFNYRASDGTVHQIWYDDPQSLKAKYQLAASQGMRGVAVWNIDCLDYTSSKADNKAETQEMWDALSAFHNY